MEHLNPKSTAVFFKLISEIGPKNPCVLVDEHNYWPECGGGIMSVHVQRVDDFVGIPKYSVAHYYYSGDDCIADPEMNFLVNDGKVYPIKWVQPCLGMEITGVVEEEVNQVCCIPDQQRKLVTFADQWLENVAVQQSIFPNKEE